MLRAVRHKGALTSRERILLPAWMSRRRAVPVEIGAILRMAWEDLGEKVALAGGPLPAIMPKSPKA